MDLYEAIRKRYSVRAFLDKEVEKDKLDRILEAARLAPSASNRQEWKLIVVRDAEVQQALAQAAEQPFVGQAPVVIAAVGLTPQQTMYCDVPTDPVDCAIVLEHVALAATAEGLGTCWIGHFKQDQCRKALGVPDSARVIELMPLGYPAVDPGAKTRKSLKETVCQDRFS